MWGVFFCYLILSTFQLFSLWRIFFFFSGVNFGNETHCQKLHTEMQQRSDCRQCSLWAWLQLLSVWTTLRLRGRGLLLQRCLIFFFFSSANLFYKCALLGLTMQFIPRNYFCLKTVSYFNSDCELLWKYFVNGCFFAMVRWANLGFCHVLTSTWLVSGHSQIVTYFCMIYRGTGADTTWFQ